MGAVIYHVQRRTNGRGGWEVRRKGAPEASALAASLSDALERALTLAAGERASGVLLMIGRGELLAELVGSGGD
jgi:hypothetical protein